MELITVDIRFKIPTKNILILKFLRLHSVHQFFHWRTKHPELTKEETVTQKKSNSWLFDFVICSFKYTLFVVHQTSVAEPHAPRTPLSPRALWRTHFNIS